MNKNSEKVKQVVNNAKSIPASIYQLVFINIVLFIGLVCRQLPFLYIVGCFTFISILLVIIAKVTNLFKVPSQILSQNIQYRLQQLRQKIQTQLKRLSLSKLSSQSINTIVSILLIVYVSSMLNDTIEIFLIVNYVFLIVFMPRETQGFIGVVCENLENVLGKIKYSK